MAACVQCWESIAGTSDLCPAPRRQRRGRRSVAARAATSRWRRRAFGVPILPRWPVASIIVERYGHTLPFGHPSPPGLMILLRLLGGLSLTTSAHEPLSGRAAQRHRIALLALLGAPRSDPVSRERLASILWPDAGQRSRHLLSNSVHIVRKALGEDAIVGTADALRYVRLVRADRPPRRQPRREGGLGGRRTSLSAGAGARARSPLGCRP